MAKYLVSGYTFVPGVPGSGSITISGVFPLEQFLLATNVTDNVVIYQFNSPARGGNASSASGNTTLFFNADTSGMSAADKVQLFVDDGADIQVEIANASVEISNDSGNPVPASIASVPLPSGAASEATASGIRSIVASGVNVFPANITSKFRESFESFSPGINWNLTAASGDIIQLDGNAVSASYLVISKDPLTVGSETILESIATYDMPLEASVGLGMSQRVLGQELALEIISTDAGLTPPSELTISSISQATTTLTVNTSAAHNLVPGRRIGIYGVSDSRFNHPSLVVATIPSTTQFTCTAGPGGTIPSVTAGPFTSGFVYHRSALGYARDGMSQIFENASTNNSSFYVRANSGDALPGGTANGNHSQTSASTTGTQLINAAFTYAWLPASEYRYILQADRVQLQDTAVDATGQANARTLRTQVVPDFLKQYKLRFRFSNVKGLTIPTAQIVSAVKAGSTTATITTSSAHGLTTGDQIVIYGIRDQTNFANLTVATAVASTPTSTSFTIAFGTSVTATSYGGMVSRVQGGNIPAAFTTVAIQSAANDGTALILVGTANWTALVGDYVNVYGCRDNLTGASLNVDGVYKVANTVSTTITLLPIGDTTLPTSFATTNAGGTIIKRTDLRLSFARIFDYLRERVEVQANSAAAAAVPVQVTHQPTVTALGTAGSAAHDAAVAGNPVRIAGRALTANYANVATGDTADLITTLQGVLITRPHQISELEWSYVATSSGISNTADVSLAGAAGAGLRRYLTSLAVKNANATVTEAVVKDGSTIIWRGHLGASMASTDQIIFNNPLKTSANAALNFACVASGAQVYVNAQGYTAP